MKAVVLDGYTLNPGDLSWAALEKLVEVEVYPRTPPEEIVARSSGAEIVLTNKTPLREASLRRLPRLGYIGVLATGYDVVDVAAARELGVVVTNVPTYGTDSVAQFTFALLLELCHRVQRHADSVSSGGWARSSDWSYHLSPLAELAGKTLGVIGLGRIGRRVAGIGRAFGMTVIAADANRGAPLPFDGFEWVETGEIFARADVVTLHCPLTPETRGLVNARRLARMKPNAMLINTSRGPLVVEHDLAEALAAGRLAGAALDVLPVEPPVAGSPLLSAPNCIVTPHIAWATKEARERLLRQAVLNVAAFLEGAPVNAVGG